MDGELAIRWLLSPYATALAAGALFAFCVALLKQRYGPKRRRDSAPESTVRKQEPEFQESESSPGLTKWNSENSLRTGKWKEGLPKPISKLPIISNFPAFDGRPVPSINSLPCIAKAELRPFTLSDDLINLERRFLRFSGTKSGSGISKSNSYSLPNFHKSAFRSNPCFLGSIYPSFQPFSRRVGSFQSIFCSKYSQTKWRQIPLERSQLSVIYGAVPAESPSTNAAESRGTHAAENVLKEDFCPLRSEENYALRRRKSISIFSDKTILHPVPHYVTDCSQKSATTAESVCSEIESKLPEFLSKDPKVTGIRRNSVELILDSSEVENRSSNKENKTCKSNPTYAKVTESSNNCVKNSNINTSPVSDSISNKKNTFSEINAVNTEDSYDFQNLSKFPLANLTGVEFSFPNKHGKFLEFHVHDSRDIPSSTATKKPNQCCNCNRENKLTDFHRNESESVSDSQIFLEFPSANRFKILNLCSGKESILLSALCFSEKEHLNKEGKSEAPPVLGNCQNIEDAFPRCATVDTYEPASFEAKKSINRTKMSNDSLNSAKENLEGVQEASDKSTEVMTPRKTELSFALETKQTIRSGPNSAVRPGEIPFGDEAKKKAAFRVTNDRDVRRAGGGRGAETSHTRTDEREAARQMDRGTGDRSVDGSTWNSDCAPVRVFESTVTSEIHGGDYGVSTAVVSSVTLDGSSDVWSSSEIDTTYRNGKDDHMSIRTVSSNTDHSPPAVDTTYRNDDHMCVRTVTSRNDHSVEELDITYRNGRGGPVHVRTVTSSTDLSPAELDTTHRNRKDDHVSVRTVTSGTDPPQPYRPNFEEFMPVPSGGGSLDETIKELNEIAGRPLVLEESPPRVSRLLGLLNRDEERRARAQLSMERPDSKRNGTGNASIEEEDGEWDRILRDVLASVSELESWGGERRRRDVIAEDAESDRQLQQTPSQSHSSPTMEEEALLSPTKGETPTKVKNLRFKLDPDIFDVPSDDSFYDDDDDIRRPGWRRQPKYRAFHTLELGDEPVKLVSVHASVVPAGQKMVARPVGIDLRVRLTEERQSKRAHVGTSPSQAKRRSPVSDSRVGWCQELSPVTENVDWRETFATVPKEINTEVKPVPNGILKTPSPKAETLTKDSSNPFKAEGELTNGSAVIVPEKREKPVTNGMTSWNPPQRKFSLPRKKFEPDPEAVDRITGYKIALSKPPLPPPVFHKLTPPSARSRAEMARKQYLDSKAALSASKPDGSRKFQQFLTQAQNDRARIVTSVPDLGAIERAVNEKWAKERGSASPRASPARDDTQKLADTPSSRGSTPDDAWTSYVQTCRKHLGRRSQSMSYLETDIDVPVVEDDDKWRSTSALDEPDIDDQPLPIEDSDFEQSREDLDDSGRAKSEHELRIQKSLQSLPLPDWYKRSDKPKTGFLLKSSEKEKRGWAAAKSLASSTSSLASCGVKRPVHSLRSSRENIPWSRGSASPDGPALSLALARAFREPYLGWRARTSTSSGVSSSPRTSPPSSWCAATTDEETNGVSFDGEDAFGRTSSEDGRHEEPPSLDDTGADAVTVSMDTGDLIKLPGGEDTCDDINNMSMDTCELFDSNVVPDVDVDEPSQQADTGDDIDNLSTDTTEEKKKDPKSKRYSYSQSIYHSEWDDEESRGDRKGRKEERDPSPSSDQKVIWIESSFVGSRTTTSIVVLPEGREKLEGNCIERPASR